MKNNKIFRMAIILFCLGFILTGIVSNGATSSEIKQQQQANAEKKKEIQKKLDAAQDELDKQQAELSAVVREKEQNMSELEVLERELNYILDQLKVLEQTIKETEEDYNNKVATLKDRARIMYQLSDYTTLEMLIESDSLLDFMNRKSYYNTMINQDQQLIDEVANLKAELESKKALQERTRGGYEELISKKETLIAGLKNKEATYSQLTKKAQSAVDALEAEEEAMEKAGKELEQRLKKIAEEEARAKANANSGGSSGGGATIIAPAGGDPNFNPNVNKFIWPAPASHYITSPFGYRIHPISGQYKMHNGVDIGAGYGTNILAAQSGKVIEAGYHSSHGNYVVIYHGNGWATAYYHASRLLVSAGQNVTRGQVIALVGSTGSSTGPHLHFEVRYNGAVQNPLNYVS